MRLRQSFHPSLFFFNDTATTEIFTLSLHDALPIYAAYSLGRGDEIGSLEKGKRADFAIHDASDYRELAYFPFSRDRKSTRLNSSHTVISYAVFCLKKKTTCRRREGLHDLHN